MAKDGTNRGGKRPGAGRKKKPLAEKIQEGQKAIALAMPEQDGLDGEDVERISVSETSMVKKSGIRWLHGFGRETVRILYLPTFWSSTAWPWPGGYSLSA